MLLTCVLCELRGRNLTSITLCIIISVVKLLKVYVKMPDWWGLALDVSCLLHSTANYDHHVLSIKGEVCSDLRNG